jgi:hypothetical protein
VVTVAVQGAVAYLSINTLLSNAPFEAIASVSAWLSGWVLAQCQVCQVTQGLRVFTSKVIITYSGKLAKSKLPTCIFPLPTLTCTSRWVNAFPAGRLATMLKSVECVAAASS